MHPTQPRSIHRPLALTAWLVAGIALIILGFLLDGSIVVGHHAALIAGGMLIGYGAHTTPQS